MSTSQDAGEATTSRGLLTKGIGILLALAITGLLALLLYGLLSRGSDELREARSLEPAPDFGFEVYQGLGKAPGATVRLSDLRGAPVVLNFWGGLCAPCRAEMPDLQQMSETYDEKVVILGIDVGPLTVNSALGTREDGQALLKELGITYPAGVPVDVGPVAAYNILGMPTTVFITPQGAIWKRWTGYLTKESMVAFIEELLEAT